MVYCEIIFCGRFGDEWKISVGMTFNCDNDIETRDFDVDGGFMVIIVMYFQILWYGSDSEFS